MQGEAPHDCPAPVPPIIQPCSHHTLRSLLTAPSCCLQVVLQGQRVLPSRALQQGFKFRYSDVHNALENVMGKAP